MGDPARLYDDAEPNHMLGAMTSIKHADGTTHAFLYDENGRLVGSTSDSGTTYKIEWSSPVSYEIYVNDVFQGKVWLNELGSVVKTTDALNRTISYAYDENDRLESVVDAT